VRVPNQHPSEPKQPDGAALLRAFTAVVQAGARFPTNSPRLLDPCRDLLRTMRSQLGVRRQLTLRVDGSGLRVGTTAEVLLGRDPDVRWLADRLTRAGLSGIDVKPGTRPELLAELAAALRKCTAPGGLPFAQIWGIGGPGIDCWPTGTAPDVRPWSDIPDAEVPRTETPRRPGLGAPPSRPLRSSGDLRVRSRPLAATVRSMPRRDEADAASAPSAPRASSTCPSWLIDDLSRQSSVRDVVGRIRFRFEREYGDREFLDVEEMLGAVVGALPEADLTGAERVAEHVSRVLEAVAAQLEAFLQTRPSQPGTALQELALQQVPESSVPAVEVTMGAAAPLPATRRPLSRMPVRTAPDAEPTTEPGDETLGDVEALVAGFPNTLHKWLDASSAGTADSGLLATAIQRLGEGLFLSGCLELVDSGELLTPDRVRSLLQAAGPAAAPIAATLASRGATWTRGLVHDFLRGQPIPSAEARILELLDTKHLPAPFLADLCAALPSTTAPAALSRFSLVVLMRYLDASDGEVLEQERRLAVLDVIQGIPGDAASDLLENLSQAGQFVDRSPAARRFRAAAAAALRRRASKPDAS
jgi:hypothetical protein